MSYTIEQSIAGIRIVFPRRYLSRPTAVIAGGTAALWVTFLNLPFPRYFIVFPMVFSVLFVASFINREAIEVDHENFTHWTTDFGVTWAMRYKLDEVLGPHWEPDSGQGRRRIPSYLVFEYRGSFKRMIGDIQPSEVEDILTEITKRFPELAKRWKMNQQLYGSTDITTLNL